MQPTPQPQEGAVQKAENRSAVASTAKAELAFITPPVDVLESDNEILVLADLPGVKSSDLDIQFEKETLTFVGRREAAGIAYERSFVVPRDVDPDGIAAELSDGVLKLHLHKHPSRKAKSIQIKAR